MMKAMLKMTVFAGLIAVGSCQTQEQIQQATDEVIVCAKEYTDVMTADNTCNALMSGMAMASVQETDDAAITEFCVSTCFVKMRNLMVDYGECVSEVYSRLFADSTPAVREAMAGAFSNYGRIFDVYCTRNEATGKPCMSHFLQLSTEISTAVSATADVKVSLCDAYSNMGCCLSSLFFAISHSTYNTMLEGLCGWTDLPPRCPLIGESVKVVKGSFRLNLDPVKTMALSEADQIKLRAEIKRDLAASLQINQAYLTVGEFTEVDGKVKVDYTVRGMSDTDTIAARGKIALFGIDNVAFTEASVTAQALEASNSDLEASDDEANTETITTEAGADPPTPSSGALPKEAAGLIALAISLVPLAL